MSIALLSSYWQKKFITCFLSSSHVCPLPISLCQKLLANGRRNYMIQLQYASAQGHHGALFFTGIWCPTTRLLSQTNLIRAIAIRYYTIIYFFNISKYLRNSLPDSFYGFPKKCGRKLSSKSLTQVIDIQSDSVTFLYIT